MVLDYLNEREKPLLCIVDSGHSLHTKKKLKNNMDKVRHLVIINIKRQFKYRNINLTYYKLNNSKKIKMI